MSESNNNNLIKGMISGVALGDALGAPFEFYHSLPLKLYTGELIYPPTTQSRFQGKRAGVIGQVTDDTEMTLTLYSILKEDKKFNRDKIIIAYQAWTRSKPFGVGKNTRAIFGVNKTVRGYESKAKRVFTEGISQSNGSLMRASPLVLIFDPEDPKEILQDTRLSNPNPVNEEATLLYVMALWLILKGEKKDKIFTEIKEKAQEPDIIQAFKDVELEAKRDINGKTKGWVAHGFYCALYALWHFNGSYSEVISRVIRLGGDTDTNAAIAGGLIGALMGYEKMLEEEITGNNLKILYSADTSDGDFPRPDMYHIKTYF